MYIYTHIISTYGWDICLLEEDGVVCLIDNIWSAGELNQVNKELRREDFKPTGIFKWINLIYALEQSY